MTASAHDPRLERVLGLIPGYDEGTAQVVPLRGGITNRNYKINLHDVTHVLKLDGKRTQELGIDRDREHACALVAASLGVGPEVVCYLPDYRSLVTRFIEGEPVSRAAAGLPRMLQRIAASIRRIHDGPDFPGKFSPFQTVRRYHLLCRRRRVRLPPDAKAALELMKGIEKSLGRAWACRPCHNDLLASNFIDDGKVIRILDWEYAAMGDPFFDLGNFAVNQRLNERQCALLLAAYAGRTAARDLARLRLYGMASDLREAWWGFLQSALSALDFDFLGYGAKHLDRFMRAARGPAFVRRLAEAAR